MIEFSFINFSIWLNRRKGRLRTELRARRSATLRFRDSISFVLVFASVLITASVDSTWAFNPDEDLTARAAVLMDAATGKILYQKEPELRLPPASTTKVLTADRKSVV